MKVEREPAERVRNAGAAVAKKRACSLFGRCDCGDLRSKSLPPESPGLVKMAFGPFFITKSKPPEVGRL